MEYETRADFHLFTRRGKKISGGVQTAPLSEVQQGLGVWVIYLFIYLLTSAVNRNINIYKQDGSGTLTQREPITLVTCYKTIKYTQNFATYNFKYQTRI
jgi:hypothetical protein